MDNAVRSKNISCLLVNAKWFFARYAVLGKWKMSHKLSRGWWKVELNSKDSQAYLHHAWAEIYDTIIWAAPLRINDDPNKNVNSRVRQRQRKRNAFRFVETYLFFAVCCTVVVSLQTFTVDISRESFKLFNYSLKNAYLQEVDRRTEDHVKIFSFKTHQDTMSIKTLFLQKSWLKTLLAIWNCQWKINTRFSWQIATVKTSTRSSSY